MTSSPTIRLALIVPCLLLACVMGAPKCGAQTVSRVRPVAYRLSWIATRASDHAPFIAVSQVIRPGQSGAIVTDSNEPAEEKPAFPGFNATLSLTKTPGVYELYTRARLREVKRNKKGKLVRSKRTMTALIPIRPGEVQQVSSTSDPIHLEVRLEPE